MMVRPELPYSPGMEVMGVVDACGAGTEEWQGRRVVAMPKGAHGGFAEYAICPAVSAFDMPDVDPAARRGRALLPVPPRVARALRPRRPAGRRERAHPRRGRRIGIGRDPTRQARRRAVFATAGTDEKVQLCRELGADVAINYNDADFAEVVLAETGEPGRRRRVRQRRRGGDGEVDAVHRLQRPLPDDGLRVEQGRGRRAVHRAAARSRGNFKLCGVLLSYALPEMAAMVKQAMGLNFATREPGPADQRRDRRPRARERRSTR